MNEVLGTERRRYILEAVRRRGSVQVAGLAAELGVTGMTIRRDLAILAERGAVDRVHGGAVTPAEANRLVRDRPLTIAMVVPTLGYWWGPLAQAVRTEAAGRGMRLVVTESRSYGRDTQEIVSQLRQTSRIDGFLLSPPTEGPERREIDEWLATLDAPVVLVEREPGDTRLHDVSSVGTNGVVGAALAVHHLHGRGHRRIAFMAPASGPGVPARIEGWRRALIDLDLPAPADWRYTSVSLTASHRDRQLGPVLDAMAADGVTGVLVVGDPHALALMDACRDRGVVIPRDLSVIGYDDELAALADPPLTSVQPPRHELAEIAVRLVTDRLLRPERVAQQVLIAPRLTIRASTAPPA
ncbi:substrate-binding domain-containing protein [Propionibacteriaceae bacterium Y2011]